MSDEVKNDSRLEDDVRVYGSNHTGLAVLALRAVEPDGFIVRDADSVGQERVVSGSRGGGHEARVEGVCLVRHDVRDGYARVVKRRLDDGVVLFEIRCC